MGWYLVSFSRLVALIYPLQLSKYREQVTNLAN